MNNQDKTPQGITPNLPLWSYQLQQDSKLALKTRKDLEIHLITRAFKDEDFKRDLIANPKMVIERELRDKLPDELEINVLEETEDTIYMVLPCNPYEGLSEEELQTSLGMSYEDVAQWVLEQQYNKLFDKEKSINIVSELWRNQILEKAFLSNPIKYLQSKGVIQTPIINLKINVLSETPRLLFVVLPNTMLDSFEALYCNQCDNELMLNILASPCWNSHPDPCCTGTIRIP